MLAATVAALAAAAPAAAHHSLLIREVRASGVTPDQAFVELQTYREGQNDVTGAQVIAYDATGLAQTPFTLPSGVPGRESQRTILVAGPGVAGADFTFAGLGAALSPTGGAVCVPEAIPPDCVSWGAFTARSQLPFPGAGLPAPAIAEGGSLTRTVARGCALGLDPEDDSDSSAADFSPTAPTPQPNAVTPADRDCVPCGGLDATIIGSNGKETIKGTSGRDVIAALAGADVVRGLGGADTICGGIGKDVLAGGSGRDKLVGGRGRDDCRGGKGRDSLRSCEGSSG